MLSGHSALAFYHCSSNQYVTLEDKIKIPVLVHGASKFTLNDKMIFVPTPSMCPSFAAPFAFSSDIKIYQAVPPFSYQKLGSYQIFPAITLQIDDSHYKLVRYNPPQQKFYSYG